VARQALSLILGQVVRRHRLVQELSQEALAEKADVHSTYISLLANGHRAPGVDVAERIAKALGMRLSVLIAEAEQTKS
jgi:transcriptional regulator with XRE-family HTH domain